MGSIFNVIGCSAALLCHFAGNPAAHPKFRQIHRLLLNSLRDAPRDVRLHSLRHFQGFCFACDIDEDLPDDRYASSTIFLFEDGKSLRHPHVRDAAKIVGEGSGRYQHSGRTIFFSTSDNSSPLTNGRNYVAIHSLTTDKATFQRFVGWKKASKATGAARLFEMLQTWSPSRFSYEAMTGDGGDVSLSGLRLAIDRGARMQIVARAISVRAITGTQWEFEIADMASAAAPNELWSLGGKIDLAPDAAGLLAALTIRGPGGATLSFGRDASGTLQIRFGKLHTIKPAMMAWFDDAVELDRWMSGIVRLVTAPPSDGGFGLVLDPDSAETLAQVLSERVGAHYALSIRSDGNRRPAVLRQVAHDD